MTRARRPSVGWREWVGLPDLGVAAVKAKVDTGARSSSLHAWDLEIEPGPPGAENRDGWTETNPIVRFCVHPFQEDDFHVVETAAPLLDLREVRSSNGEVEVRPVIATTALVRGASVPIELTLSRRDEMGFRMLLGRAAIRRRFVVDPARSFLGGGDRVSPP